MSRPAAVAPSAGLAALRAAVAEARREEMLRAARAAVAAGTAGPGAGCARAAVPSRRRAAAAAVPAPAAPGDGQVGGVQAAVPSPSPAADDAVRAPSDAVPAPSPAAHDALPAGDAADAFALVQRAQAGDPEAFGLLYDRYVDVVFRYVSYRVGSRQLAEDLTSETFLRALRRIGSFTWQGRDVGAWLVTIARNLLADHYKSSRYRLETTTDDVTAVGDGRLVEDSPEGQVLEQMQNAVLLEAVRRLNPEQQECIALRFLQGMSVAETAAVMGRNEGAVKALQYRAIRTLGRLLPEGVEL